MTRSRSPLERCPRNRIPLVGLLAPWLLALVPAMSTADNVAMPAAMVAATTAELEPSSDELVRFAGRWDQVADADAEVARLENIDAALADLSWLVRKMASGVIRDSTAPPPEVRFTWNGDALAQHLEVDGERFVRPVTLSESAVAEGPRTAREDAVEDGENRWAWRDGRLEVLWTRDQARGFTRFRYDPSDDSLHVDYEIHVTALDGAAPIRYASRFERHAPPSVGTAPRSVQISGVAPAGGAQAE